jgi:hypothetical protein
MNPRCLSASFAVSIRASSTSLFNAAIIYKNNNL